MKVIWFNSALADVEGQYRYILQHNPKAASELRRNLIESTDQLEQMPNIGRQGAEPGTRELIVLGKYILIYRVVADEIHVLRVWHGAQDRP